MTSHAGLFEENGDAAQILASDYHYRRFTPYMHLAYTSHDTTTDSDAPPSRHIIAELCARAGITGEVALRPYLKLTDAELDKASWAAGKIAIQSSGMDAKFPMRNKQWFPERFQEVVDALHSDYAFVQVGSSADPPLSRTRDLRGQTSLRQAAAILFHARLFIGNVGFLMHAARAVDCPSVIVYGGRESPWQSGYSANRNLYSPVPCAPCWLWNRCEFDHICMTKITPAEVVRAARGKLAEPRTPLPVDTAIISPSDHDRVSAET
jgi:ADP-heptose:LPS heptosyltransferase